MGLQALKPRPEPYRLVAESFGVPIGDVRLVAAHAWDIAGALAAGCTAALEMIEAGSREAWSLDAERIECPVRIVWGTADKLLPWPIAWPPARRPC